MDEQVPLRLFVLYSVVIIGRGAIFEYHLAELYETSPVRREQTGEAAMTETKPDTESDAARTCPEADKNREELVKRAEKGIKDSKGNKPTGEI